jgi:hypothetical protein
MGKGKITNRSRGKRKAKADRTPLTLVEAPKTGIGDGSKKAKSSPEPMPVKR